MKRIAWIIKRPLHPRDMKRLGIQAALDRGYYATVVDVSEVLHPSLDNRRTFVPDKVKVRTPIDGSSMLSEFRSLAGFDIIALFIISRHLSKLVFMPMRALSRLDVPMLIMAPQPIPSQSIRKTRWHSFLDLFCRVRDAEPLTSLLARLPLWLLGVREVDYIVYGSNNAEVPSRMAGPKTKRIYAHSWDYEQIRECNSDPIVEKNQAVFIDQYAPFHPDFVDIGGKMLDPQHYYGLLNQLFERIERHHGLKVVVAAHPRADYSDKPWAFPGRRIVTGETTRLTIESRLVIAHHSTALHQAVAAEKPIMLLVSQAMLEIHSMHPSIFQSLASELRRKLNYIDDPDSIDVASCLSSGAHDTGSYIAKYLRHSKSKSLQPLWDIIFEELGWQ